jgi:hypothetical protein
MSYVHVKINFSFGIDSWNRCLSVLKRPQIRALARQTGNRFLDSLKGLKKRAQVLYYKEGGISFKIRENSKAS